MDHLRDSELFTYKHPTKYCTCKFIVIASKYLKLYGVGTQRTC